MTWRGDEEQADEAHVPDPDGRLPEGSRFGQVRRHAR